MEATYKQTQLSPEDIVKNYETYSGLLLKSTRSPQIQEFLNVFEDRLAMCPASGRAEYHSAYPGGLIEHSLKVLKFAKRLRDAYQLSTIENDSLIICSLLHDIGKLGDVEHEYYVVQDSSWHREKLGEFYKKNPNLKFMTVPDRSLFLCQMFGIKLSSDEFIAIKIHDGLYDDANKPYAMKEPDFALLLHHADLMACRSEKSENV